MAAGNFLSRLKSVAKNAVVWGTAWFGLTMVTFAVVRVFGGGSGLGWRFWLLGAISIGVRAGIIGGIAGSAFSVLISKFYRGRRLSDINALRFGIGGGVVAGVVVPAFFVAANVLTGDGVPRWSNIDTDAMMAALFGGVTAGVSMWLAQRGERLAIDRPDSLASLGEGPASAELGETRFDRHEGASSPDRDHR